MSISCIEHAKTELRPLRNIVHTSVQKLGQGLVAPLAEFWGKLDSESRRISQNLSESLESFGILEILNPRRGDWSKTGRFLFPPYISQTNY
jgi:hypothetical protein